MDKKSLITMALLLGIVIVVIAIINYAGGESPVNGNTTVNSSSENLTNEQVIECIGKGAQLIVSPTCGYCAKQKQDLSEYYENYTNYIEIVDISKNPGVLENYEISGVPSWIINGEVNSGYKPISKIKGLTNC